MTLTSCRFIWGRILIAERFAWQRFVYFLQMSVVISVFRKAELGNNVGDHVSYFMKVDIVVYGVLRVATRIAVAVLVAIRCISIDYDLVGT